MTTAWAYIRVSSDKQAKRGLPVEGQRESIRQYAEAHELRVDRWYIDEARTGTNDQRDQFQALVADARKHGGDLVILMWAWNRFAREMDDALYYKADLRRRGIEIIPTNGEIPADLPKALRNIMEAVVHMQDENASAEISRNTMRGKATLAAAGYIPTGVPAPPGYCVEFEEIAINGRKRRVRRWVPDPETWPLARRAWDMRLAGATYQEIWDAWPATYKAQQNYSCFFANPAYKGQVHMSGAVIEIEPMVTPEEWQQVNAGRGLRRSGAYARRKCSTFLLSGLAVCARCGALLWGGQNNDHVDKRGYHHGIWRLYQCPNHVRYGGCDLPRVGANRLERMVIETLMTEILTEENLIEQAAAIRAEADSERPAMQAQLAALERDLAELEGAIANLLDVIETGNSSPSVARRLAEREQEREGLRERLADARAHLDGVSPDDIDLPAIRAALQAAMDAGPVPTARALLSQFVAEVIVDAEEVVIRYRYPFVRPTGV